MSDDSASARRPDDSSPDRHATSDDVPSVEARREEADASGKSSEPGRLIAGRYQLETRIGDGAMGTVWSGQDDLLRRPVAIKEVLLPPGLPEHEAAELRERTLREARAIAVVTHPNVVMLYDVAQENDVPFVVMELVPSQSLATLLTEHAALENGQVVLVADAVAAALEAAHRVGIVHRDVKPGNVLIADDGRIKLSDFGIARNIAEPTLTRTGIMLGTPAFIAPEVASGEPITSAADAWGLGATLFAAVEGRPPYDADDDPLATITSVVHDPVPRPTIGGPLAEVIAGLMVKDPAQRMPLHQVRRLVRPLLAEAGERPFEMLLDPDAPTVRVRPPAASAKPTPRRGDTASEPEAPAQLAADPGPLPFTPRDPAPKARARLPILAVLGLSLAALLLFVVTFAGGFAATRVILGQPVLPVPDAPPKPPDRPVFQIRADQAVHASATKDGEFSIPVPQHWTTFHGQRNQDLATSMAVHFVSPDGHREIVVERFGTYFNRGNTVSDYMESLPVLAAGSSGVYMAGTDVESPEVDPVSDEHDRALTYDTIERPQVAEGENGVRRSSVVRIMPRNGDLWLVRVTVPGTETRAGEELMESIIHQFHPPN